MFTFFAILEDVMAALNSPYQKVAFTIDEDTTRTGQFLFKKPPDRLKRRECILKGIGMRKHNHAFWLIEDTMRILIPAGIPQWTRKFIYEVLFRELKEEEDEPKVFSVEDFQFGFVIWGIACGISFVAFLMEIFYFHVIKLIVHFVVVKNLEFIK
jgi:hypothetical protein